MEKTDPGGRIFEGSERTSRADNYTPHSEDSPVELAFLGQTVYHRLDDASVPTQLESQFSTVARQVRYLNPTRTPPRQMNWHPEITPYRPVMVPVLPISFATVKAVVRQTGNRILTITLEWVSGVVAFLMSVPLIFDHRQNIHADIYLDPPC